MAMSALIKSLEDIMRKDAGLNGDAQYIEQITWLLFLKAFDAKEMEWVTCRKPLSCDWTIPDWMVSIPHLITPCFFQFLLQFRVLHYRPRLQR